MDFDKAAGKVAILGAGYASDNFNVIHVVRPQGAGIDPSIQKYMLVLLRAP